MAKRTEKKGKSRRVKKSGAIRWCLTVGWGNTAALHGDWQESDTLEKAYEDLANAAKRMCPRVFTTVWTQSFLENGVVCDFGSHTYFGFIEGVKFPGMTVGKPECSVPDESCDMPCGAPDYLETKWGKALRDMFNGCFDDFMLHKGDWWAGNALRYCLLREWWTMFSEEEPSISEIWDRDMSPQEIFHSVRRWAAESAGAPAILLQDSPDLRWQEFHNAFTWGEKR